LISLIIIEINLVCKNMITYSYVYIKKIEFLIFYCLNYNLSQRKILLEFSFDSKWFFLFLTVENGVGI